MSGRKIESQGGAGLEPGKWEKAEVLEARAGAPMTGGASRRSSRAGPSCLRLRDGDKPFEHTSCHALLPSASSVWFWDRCFLSPPTQSTSPYKHPLVLWARPGGIRKDRYLGRATMEGYPFGMSMDASATCQLMLGVGPASPCSRGWSLGHQEHAPPSSSGWWGGHILSIPTLFLPTRFPSYIYS